MFREQLADKLTGREYGSEITEAEEAQAKADRLVVIFGYSDDNLELRGAIDDEVSAWGGTTVVIADGNILEDIEDDREVLEKYGFLEAVEKKLAAATKIEAKWDEGGYSWLIETRAPHSTFEILCDGEKFCRGIVIDLKEIG